MFGINLEKIDIEGSIFSGQSFRWERTENEHKTCHGVVDGKLLIIEYGNVNSPVLKSTSRLIDGKSLEEFARRYFSLDIDGSNAFPESFKRTYPEVWQLLQPYLQVKILRQAPFETLVTFMCAQGIGMNIIRRQVKHLTEKLGTRHRFVLESGPIVYHAFPTPEALASADPDALKLCTNNNCIRARNIVDAAAAVASGRLDLEALRDPEMPLETARERLCRERGIGLKIADCVMLFGLQRFSAFPIDTHVHQYLGAWFSFGEALKSLTGKTYLSLQRRAAELFDPELAGFAGHILFHAWRKEVKRLQSF